MYIPLRNHSHYSLLMSSQRTDDIAEQCSSHGYEYAGITDISSMSGCVAFIKSCNSNKIKPIIGSEVTLKDGSSITLFCRNINGWKKLLKIISRANDVDNFDDIPKIDINELSKMVSVDEFICIDGYVGSYLFNSIITNTESSFFSTDSESAVKCLKESWSNDIESHIENMKSIFGQYFLEINNFDNETFPMTKLMSECILSIRSKEIQDILIPGSSSYYVNRKDSIDHRILLCSGLKTTIKDLEDKIVSLKNINLLKFIRSNDYYIKSPQEISKKYPDYIISNIDKIPKLIDNFSVLSNPKLPNFNCPNNMSQNDYLKSLCRDGWRKLINPLCLDDQKTLLYKNRVLEELSVIEEANLAGYFLIVQDYVNHFKSKGNLLGPGRGSAAGSLVAFLLGITLIDPIKYNLLFSRFYNKGRNTKDHISLPDIDVDFPPSIREDVIEYLKEKYFPENVCQMVTFSRLQGRSILKEVLRINNFCGFQIMNQITENIPSDAAISDELEIMENPSTIIWALENLKDKLSDFCWMDEEGKLQGEYSKAFEQAIRLEGLYKSQGKHAAGVVISLEKLDDICPMIMPSNGDIKIAGMEMGHLEAIGCVKFDILGVSLLERITGTIEDINKTKEDL